jgi:hypothetical protein
MSAEDEGTILSATSIDSDVRTQWKLLCRLPLTRQQLATVLADLQSQVVTPAEPLAAIVEQEEEKKQEC